MSKVKCYLPRHAARRHRENRQSLVWPHREKRWLLALGEEAGSGPSFGCKGESDPGREAESGDGEMSPVSPAAVGISWECASSNHDGCQTPGCRCPHHYRPDTKPPQRELVSTPLERTATPPNDALATPPSSALTCPKCGSAGLAGDKFCRRDGAKLLSSLHCPLCNTIVGEGDLYCPNCGSPTTSEITVR